MLIFDRLLFVVQVSENDMRNLLYCDFADAKSETRQYIPVRYYIYMRYALE